MDLTDDLVAVQGTLISVMKTTGEFTKINYRGGNEENILKIMAAIAEYIHGKNYIKNGKINSVFEKRIEDIVTFLAINTKYKKSLELEDYDHLIDIMPQLSKCVLANIVYGLDLCKYFCKVIEKLPLSYGIELLDEMVPCLKKSLPEIQLRYAIMILRASARKLSLEEISGKDEDDVYKLLEITNILLQFLTGINPSHLKNLKEIQIYQHMGYTLLSFFELLLQCNKENTNLKKFIENIINTCCVLVQNVTINVFCSWAEIRVEDESLQSLVSGKAYEFIQEYNKFKEAKELISMLGAIAKKPMTLSERIQAADITMIIKKVHIADQDQRAWFGALIGTQFFGNDEAMNCVSTWAHLCDRNDVARLLNLSLQSKNDAAKQIAMKCASMLHLDDLMVAMTRCFYENKFASLSTDMEKTESTLKLIFNTMSSNVDVNESFIRDMCLFMLESPKFVLKGIYGECLRDKCYTECYSKLFCSLKEVVRINDFGVNTLREVVLDNQPDASNLDSYVVLLSTLLEIDYLTKSQVINGLLLPLVEQFRMEKGFEQLGCVLQILLGCSTKIPATSEMTKVRWAVLNTMHDCRCTFLELNVVKQQTATYAVDVIKNLCEVHPDYNFEEEPHESAVATKCDDDFTNYYKTYLSCKTESTLLHTLYPDLNIENYAQCVSQVLRFLPRAVGSEWFGIMQEIFFMYGSEKAAELLTDVMILLCKVVQTQDPNSNTGSQVVVALRYCFQQYGTALQKIQIDSTEAIEVDITKNICRLLKHLPDILRDEYGLSFINIISQRSLKVLSNDREFACMLISINNNVICGTVARKMWR